MQSGENLVPGVTHSQPMTMPGENYLEDNVENAESTIGSTDAISVELNHALETGLNIDSEETTLRRGFPARVSEAVSSETTLSKQASAKEGVDQSSRTPRSVARSSTLTCASRPAQAEPSRNVAGSPSVEAAATFAKFVREPGATLKKLENFDKFCCDFSSAIRNVLKVYEYNLDSDTFAINSLMFKEKLLFSSDIEYAMNSGHPVKIGSGECGNVYLGRLKISRRIVAVKLLKLARANTQSLLEEAFMMQLASQMGFAAQYHGLVPIRGIGYIKIGLVCDFIGNFGPLRPSDLRGTLKDFRSKIIYDRNAHLTWLNVCLKLAKAIATFHGMGILLNDIKEDNILLRQCGSDVLEPAFIDFGLASIGVGIYLQFGSKNQTKEELMKEHSHIAPEVLLGCRSNTFSDVYSFGRVLAEVNASLHSPVLQELAEQCLDMEPLKRTSFRYIIDTLSLHNENFRAQLKQKHVATQPAI